MVHFACDRHSRHSLWNLTVCCPGLTVHDVWLGSIWRERGDGYGAVQWELLSGLLRQRNRPDHEHVQRSMSTRFRVPSWLVN